MFQAEGKACAEVVRASVHLSRQQKTSTTPDDASGSLGPDCRPILPYAQVRNLSLDSKNKLNAFNERSKVISITCQNMC